MQLIHFNSTNARYAAEPPNLGVGVVYSRFLAAMAVKGSRSDGQTWIILPAIISEIDCTCSIIRRHLYRNIYITLSVLI